MLDEKIGLDLGFFSVHWAIFSLVT